jgi:hypothetical protein
MTSVRALQNAVSQPIRIGDLARKLTSQDLTELERLAHCWWSKGSTLVAGGSIWFTPHQPAYVFSCGHTDGPIASWSGN